MNDTRMTTVSSAQAAAILCGTLHPETMFAPLRNLTFRDVEHLPLLSAREAKFKGWLPQDTAGDDRYAGLQKLCNDIIQSTVNVNMPSNLIRNDNPGPINGFGKTNKIFVADAQVWQIIRDWLHTEGIRRNWW